MDSKRAAPDTSATDPRLSTPRQAQQAGGVRGPTARVGHLLRRAYQIALENSARGFADLDLTPRQAAAVWELHARGPLSQRELGDAIGMDAPNVHGLVSRLLKRGVVTRAKDREDPRRKRVSLTQEGESIAATLPERARGAEEATLARLSPADRAALVRLLEAMVGGAGGAPDEEAPQGAGLNRPFT
ncbi:MAG: MarR family winged helix-turn-helix transcriptional regulator [Beijerinckiaceae bacterium]